MSCWNYWKNPQISLAANFSKDLFQIYDLDYPQRDYYELFTAWES